MNYFFKLKIENWKLKIPAKQAGFTHTPKSLVSGFTLTELIVVITIATIITTALVFQQAKWNDNLAVSTQAYDLALMIRQAQIYSLGVKEDTSSSGDKFNVGYGISIRKVNDADGNSAIDKFIFFADADGDKIYEVGVDHEVGPEIFLKRGVIIDDFCANDSGGVKKCAFDTGESMSAIHISFLRPESTANVIVEGSVKVPPAIILLKSPKGKVYFVKVEKNGQI